jgi:hypothetical protein
VLRALGEAASKTGSRRVEFGVRNIAVAVGAHYSTVAAVLRELRKLAADPDGWVDLVEPGRGERADLYELRIPPSAQEMLPDLRWDRGKAYALRPVFRVMGHVAALVFEALEAGRAKTITTLVPATGISRTAVAAAIDTMAAYGLVDRSSAGLVARPGRLAAAAELLGVLDEIDIQLRAYAADRRAWRTWLARHEPESSPPDEDYWWPPDDASPAGMAWALAAA